MRQKKKVLSALRIGGDNEFSNVRPYTIYLRADRLCAGIGNPDPEKKIVACNDLLVITVIV